MPVWVSAKCHVGRLLEHILCFLLNVARPFWHSASDRQALARVSQRRAQPQARPATFECILSAVHARCLLQTWAPCLLRAPARVMSQFAGRCERSLKPSVLAGPSFFCPPESAPCRRLSQMVSSWLILLLELRSQEASHQQAHMPNPAAPTRIYRPAAWVQPRPLPPLVAG